MATCRSYTDPGIGIVQCRAEHGCEGVAVAGWDLEARLAVVAGDLRKGAAGGRHQRYAAGHGLERGEAEALILARQEKEAREKSEDLRGASRELNSLRKLVIDLDAEKEALAAADTIDMTALESSFVKHAASYGDRRHISYAAWREAGVSSATLKAAGIRRSR